MKIPERFPIERIEDYHTHHIGKYYNGIQFFGTINNLERKFQVLLYLFDKEGNTLGAEINRTDITREMEYFKRNKMLENTLEKMIEKIGPYKYCDIIVKPFQIELKVEKSTCLFGLIPDHEFGSIELMPDSSISFSEPWDGSYST